MAGLMTEQQIRDLLSSAGVDLKIYDLRTPVEERTRKPLWMLHREHTREKLPIRVNSEGQVVISKVTTKVTIRTPEWILQEVARQYHWNGEYVPKIEFHAMSGTVRGNATKNAERLVPATLRELREELNLVIPESQLVPSAIPSETVFRPSTVYPGIWVEAIVSRFEVDLPDRFEIEGQFVRDSGTTVFFDWKRRLELGITI